MIGRDEQIHPDGADRSPAPLLMGVGAAGLLLVATLVSVMAVRSTARSAIDMEVRQNLQRLASAVASTIDVDRHAELSSPGQESGGDYSSINQPLTRVIQRTDGVRFVYTLRAVGGQLCFVLDGTPPGDADGDGVEDHSSLMDVYEDPDPAAWEAIEQGRPTVTRVPYTDAWGTFLSGFAPVRRADGGIECVVGVDVSVDEYNARLARVDRAALWALIPGVLISLCVGAGLWWSAGRFVQASIDNEHHRRIAERANLAKSALLANISHELRTPLTAITGFISIAMDEDSSATTRHEAASTIRHNARHLLELINDLLDMAKAEAGAISIVPAAVDMRELLRSTVAPIRLRAMEKGIELTIEGEVELPARALIDCTRVRQVLLNLLANAVKFTDRGSVVINIENTGRTLIFRIRDTGCGMTGEQVARLFQPFSQVGSSDKRRQGTGLGLAISRRLTDLMGGSLGVESRAGAGSEFIFEFPYEPAPAEEIGEPIEDDAESFTQPLSGRRILIAEDGAENRRLLRYILGRAGAEISECGDGRAALDLLVRQRHAFDLLVTDWDMPLLDGPTLARALRDGGWAYPIVSLTAHAMPEHELACLDAGCDAHLTKPIDASRLVRTCAALIDQSRRHPRAA